MIRLSQVTLRRGAKTLLEGADVSLNPGDRIGLIGANGSGKSSLFALLRGELHADKRSEEHTSELQSLTNLVCRLLLEKKKKKTETNDVCDFGGRHLFSHKQRRPDHLSHRRAVPRPNSPYLSLLCAVPAPRLR